MYKKIINWAAEISDFFFFCQFLLDVTACAAFKKTEHTLVENLCEVNSDFKEITLSRSLQNHMHTHPKEKHIYM